MSAATATQCSMCTGPMKPIGSSGVQFCPHCDNVCGLRDDACSPCRLSKGEGYIGVGPGSEIG